MKTYCYRKHCEWRKDGLCLRVICPYDQCSSRTEEVRNGKATEPKPGRGKDALGGG